MRREEMKEMKNVVAIPEGRFCGNPAEYHS